jgi:hypothetical protein
MGSCSDPVTSLTLSLVAAVAVRASSPPACSDAGRGRAPSRPRPWRRRCHGWRSPAYARGGGGQCELPRARACSGSWGEHLDGVEPCGCEREAATQHWGGGRCHEAEKISNSGALDGPE